MASSLPYRLLHHLLWGGILHTLPLATLTRHKVRKRNNPCRFQCCTLPCHSSTLGSVATFYLGLISSYMGYVQHFRLKCCTHSTPLSRQAFSTHFPKELFSPRYTFSNKYFINFKNSLKILKNHAIDTINSVSDNFFVISIGCVASTIFVVFSIFSLILFFIVALLSST